MAFNVLILGGTREGRALAEKLARDDRFAGVLSLAGRTRRALLPSSAYRIGGFGGAQGLADYLQREHVDALVDMTHPFAAQISANAVAAADSACVPLLRLERPVWRPCSGDRWTEVPDMRAAAAVLDQPPRRVFLSIGRLEAETFVAAPQHDYLIRAVDLFETSLPQARVLAARGPFDLGDERAMLAREQIELIVSKNSGTSATYAKIEAARELGLPVIMVRQPPLAAAPQVGSIEAVLSWLGERASAVANRAV